MEYLMDLLEKGKTQFHVVNEIKKKYEKSGFQLLNMEKEWKLSENGKYFVMPYPSVLFAFTTGKSPESVRIAAAHTDFPMLKLKSCPEIIKKSYMTVNVEPYGGLILSSWFDRPLGLAGKIVMRGETPFKPEVRIYDSMKPLFIIPNLAPHLKKDDKNGSIDVQKEIIPIGAMQRKGKEDGENKNHVLKYIAEDMGISEKDILDYDLYLYIHAKPEVIGLKNEFITGARIDNISSVAAITEAMTDTFCSEGNTDVLGNINIAAFFDNEEIGSRSKQGADSVLLREILDRIISGVTEDKERKLKLYANTFAASIDVAHALHPNYIEKSDITNEVFLGGGVVLKTSASQKYVTDSEAGAVIAALCSDNDIKYQRQVNRSGMAGGQTLGPLMSSYVVSKAADLGMPMLAMHSACEMVHKDDYTELVKLVKVLFLN